MSRLKSRLVGAVSLVALMGAAVAGASPANAAVTVPATAITNDANAANGSITFYNSTGGVITSGSDLTHLFDFARTSSNGRTGANKATAYFAFPDHTQADSNNWFSSQATASTTYPNATYPAPLNTATQPVAKAAATDANLAALLPSTTQDSFAGYAGILQVRVYDTGPGVSQASSFWATDIYYDQAANTWQQVYPTVPTTSISAITATPVTPAPAGTTSVALSATLSASDSSHPAGSVELFNGSTDLGAATLNAATGAITKTATVAESTSYAFKLVFTPSGAVVGSTSPVLTYDVNGPAVATTTVLSGPTSTTYGTAVTIHADVKRTAAGTAVPATAGSVQFKVDGTNVGSPVALTATGADFSFNPSGAGTNTITGTFAPADPTKFVASSDATGVTVITSAPAYAPDAQTFTTTVPAGTLVISTPYTVANPFNLGTMQLNAAGTLLSTSAPFGSTTAAATTDPGTLGTAPASSYPASATNNGVTITDTRAGSTGWTASAQTTDFTNPGLSTVIPGDNLTFTGVTPKYLAGNFLQAGSVGTQDISAFKTTKKAFAQTAFGPGTVNIVGTMGLTAPTSTKAGAYTATVTFTIV